MCYGAAVMVAALGADVVKARPGGHVDFEHHRTARCGGTAFKKCQFRAGINENAMMKCRIRSL